MLIGYSGDAQAMLEAMLKCGFLDENPLRIHDWLEYNGIFDFYSQRAKKAAEARWDKARIKADQSKEYKAKQSKAKPSIASSIASSIGEHQPAEIVEWEIAKVWWEDWKKNGADYTEFETRGAFLALQASGWMWGRNKVADPRAALERQIQTDRERKLHGGKPRQQGNKRNEGVAGAGQTDYGEAARRKVERQMAQAANQPPQAEGNGV